MHFRPQPISLLAGMAALALPMNLFATPGDVIYSEDFESGFGGWSQTVGPANSFGINNAFGSNAAFVAGDSEVRAISPVIDLSAVPGARVTLTVIRGKQMRDGDGNILSNRPELDENFYLEFLDNTGNWQTIVTEFGGGASGEVFNDVVDLPAAALHNGFRLRASTVGGDPWDNEADDFWHFDDIEIIETSSAAGDLSDCAFGDDFESGIGQWTVSGNAAIASTTYNSSGNSLDMTGQSLVTMASDLDLSGKQAKLKAWVRAGDWPGGPDGPVGSGEMLEFEYRRSNGSWVSLYDICQCKGSGDLQVDDGGVALIEVDLPNNALHSTFRLRIRNPSNASTADHWYVDDVCIAATSPVDHFAIEHDGSAINCQPEFVDIVAHAADHSTATDYADAVALSTSTNHGDWSKGVAAGTLTNNGNGSATYAFSTADKGKATLKLANTFIETLNIDVLDNPYSEAATEDGDLTFAQSGFQFVTAGGSSPVGTQIAGKPSDEAPANAIELQAIRTSDATGACEAAFTGNTAIEIAMTCETPGTCAAASGVVNGGNIATGNAGSPGSWTSMNVDFGDNTDDTAPIVFRYDEAGGVKLHVRKTLSPSGEVMSGASNEFVVRPFGLHVSADQGAITNNNPGATGPGGTAFEKAGDPFRITARAVGWQAADDADDDGIPDGHNDSDATNNADLSDNSALSNFAQESTPDTVTLASSLVAPSGGSNPSLSGTTSISAFTGGSGNSTGVRWQEVGIIEIAATLNDSDYQGAGALYGRSGHVGRFVPHHFTTAVNNHGCSDVTNFTYSGQPLRKFTVTAHAQDNTVVENFTWNGGSGFSKNITLADPAASPPGSFNSGISQQDFVNGKAEISDGVSYAFTSGPAGPYTLSIRATDSDSISSNGFTEGQTQIRSGRLLLGFAAAPEIVDARAEFDVHSWNGSAWQLETEDNCSDDAIAVGDFSYDSFTLNLDSGESAASAISFFNGEGFVTYSQPGAGNNGDMHVTLDVPAWLEFDWNGDTVAEDPDNSVMFVPKHPRERAMIFTQEIVP